MIDDEAQYYVAYITVRMKYSMTGYVTDTQNARAEYECNVVLGMLSVLYSLGLIA